MSFFKRIKKVFTNFKKACYNRERILIGDVFMQRFFEKLRYGLSGFMAGRYGVDALTLPLVIVSCACTLVSSFGNMGFLRLAGTIILIYALFRMFSRNFDKRRKELYAYSNLSQKMKKKIDAERHIKKYFKCPNCKAWLSVPKGKGKLKINCTKCHHEFIRKS